MSHTKKLLAVLNGDQTDHPPCWMMRQAGRYLPEYRQVRRSVSNFLELCYTPELAMEVTLQPLRRFDLDASILFSDILVVPDALGQKVHFSEGIGPHLEPLELDKLSLDGFTEKLTPVYVAASMIARELPPAVTFIGFAGAPWTVASYMVEGKSSKDFTLLKTMAYAQPVLFSKLIDLLTEATILHLSAQIDAGAEVVQIFDSWAGILPAAPFHQWVIAPTAKIVAALKKAYPAVPVIGFPKAAGFYYEDYLQTGVDAVSLDSTIPLKWAREHLQPNVIVQGNLDPIMLLTDKNTIQTETRRIKKELGGSPFIFNLGHGILPSTPIEHVEAMLEAVREKE